MATGASGLSRFGKGLVLELERAALGVACVLLAESRGGHLWILANPDLRTCDLEHFWKTGFGCLLKGQICLY